MSFASLPDFISSTVPWFSEPLHTHRLCYSILLHCSANLDIGPGNTLHLLTTEGEETQHLRSTAIHKSCDHKQYHGLQLLQS